MDLFSLATSTAASPELAASIAQNTQMVWSTLSDSTRNILTEATTAVAAIAPQATRNQVERAKAMIGGVFDQKQLEILSTEYALQTANAHTARTMLCHPTIATMHKLGQTDAWGEEYDALRNHLLHNRITSGFAGLDGSTNYTIVNYADNYAGKEVEDYNSLSSYHKQIVHRNWQSALDCIFNDNVDVGSIHDGTF